RDPHTVRPPSYVWALAKDKGGNGKGFPPKQEMSVVDPCPILRLFHGFYSPESPSSKKLKRQVNSYVSICSIRGLHFFFATDYTKFHENQGLNRQGFTLKKNLCLDEFCPA